jgi:methylated-DNA-[protein]-cysteine S-methyltransferase
MRALTTTVSTPDGSFSMLLADGSVLASGWTDDVAALAALVHPTLRPDEIVQARPAAGEPQVTLAVDAVIGYYDGDLAAPGRIPVVQHSGGFRMRAWDALRRVAPGKRITYTEYALRAGQPTAVRAAAAACAMNAAALFVPCHRVLRSDGGLGGFRYGLAVKQRLLDRETDSEPAPTLF